MSTLIIRFSCQPNSKVVPLGHYFRNVNGSMDRSMDRINTLAKRS